MKLASWRTSIFGTGGLAYVLFQALMYLLDGDPTTNPDWNLVMAAAMPSIGLLFARDNRVSSEAAGIKGTPPSPEVTKHGAN